ncbi:hypothetical protein BDA99DRAFT_571752 [Phascolomyces articulosus]|uniref:F-box domain-containing protein n=1 Tax=Phascolomyces articulosus TaxID=60185 RepID=A0AAD5KB07_9FUNG|nr:hypothetical protein BDA99DRAFT_571752 [Phascolomyces articulosus]
MFLFGKSHKMVSSATPTLKQQLSSSSTTNEAKKTCTDVLDTFHNKRSMTQEIVNTQTFASAKEYLVSAQRCREQNDLPKALRIYMQGLENTLSIDDPQHYSKLEREKLMVQEKLMIWSQGGFYTLMPYDALCMIFGNLGYKDLLRCTAVCRRWFDFMMGWPDFWRKILGEFPNLNKPILISLFNNNRQETHVNCPINGRGEVNNMFILSRLWGECHSIQNLYITNVPLLLTAEISLLRDTVRCMATSLRKVSLIDCYGRSHDILQRLMPVCSSGLTHTTISHYWTPNSNSLDCKLSVTLYNEPKIHIVAPPPSSLMPYPALTYLKIDISSQCLPARNCDLGYSSPILTILRQSPNIVHLFLAIHMIFDSDAFNNLFHTINKSCPRLIDLVLTRRGSMPKIAIGKMSKIEELGDTTISSTPLLANNDFIMSSLDDDNSSKKKRIVSSKLITSHITKTATLKPLSGGGLQCFVLADYDIHQGHKHILHMLKTHHTSLKILYLDFDGRNVGPHTINKLASYGCPQLQEIHIARNPDSKEGLKSNENLKSPALVRLFSACSALEVITLAESRPEPLSLNYLQVDTSVLETIARKCPHLRHLYLSDRPFLDHSHYSPKDFLLFANMRGDDGKNDNYSDGSSYYFWDKKKKKRRGIVGNYPPKLESLTMLTMDRETAFTLVKNLESLKHLHVSWWSARIDNKSKELEAPIKQILENRGGTLIYIDHNNHVVEHSKVITELKNEAIPLLVFVVEGYLGQNNSHQIFYSYTGNM